MRIAMIGSRGLPAGLSGVERVVEELTVELTALGHEVLVYARPWYLQQKKGSGPFLNPKGYPSFLPKSLPDSKRVLTPFSVITTPGLAGKNTDALTHTATAMWDVLRRKVDVVHVHCAGPALLSFIPWAASLPVVFTVHAPEWDRARWSRLGKLALRTGLKSGMKFASAVSAVSLNLREFLTDAYDREVEYIPNGVRAVQPRRLDKIGEWGLEAEGYCLYVGRIVQEKRLDLLVRVWREMKIGVPLVVAGDGRQEPEYEAACRQEANKLVRFVGPRFGDELAELYSNAALVVQPSELEGMSLVLLEAAAYGRCVVARDMPATRDALGDGVVTFGDDSTEALGEAIVKCLNDPAGRRQKGEEAKQRVTKMFSWPAIARQYERLYKCAVRRTLRVRR